MKDFKEQQFAVLGLGRFGMSIAATLAGHDANVLVCDSDPRKVQLAAEFATQAIQANIEDEANLEQIGIGNFDVVIIATGQDFEAALIATSIAKEKGAGYILAKGMSQRQKKILEGLGVDRVVLPEIEMGEKVAYSLMQPNIFELFDSPTDHAITEMHPHKDWIDKTVAASNIRAEFDISILAIRRSGKVLIPVKPDEVIRKNDLLITIKEK